MSDPKPNMAAFGTDFQSGDGVPEFPLGGGNAPAGAPRHFVTGDGVTMPHIFRPPNLTCPCPLMTHLERVLFDIAYERVQQDRKWGIQDHSNADWTPILGEEFGEACKEVYAETAALRLTGNWLLARDAARDRLRNELLQVAAVAVAWVECLDRNKTLEESDPCDMR